MARKQSWNAAKQTAELSASDAVIDPLLEAAGITTIKINGEDIPASKAPLQERINAYAAVAKAGVAEKGDVDQATLINQITAQLEKSEDALAVAQANVGSLTQEKSILTNNLSVSQANVSRLTAEVAQITDLRDNANKLASTVTAERNGLNSEISRIALSFGCLTDLKDEKGNLLTSKATAAEREAAADLLPGKDKLKSLGGACTSALQRLGVPAGTSPAQPPTGSATQAPKISRGEFNKLEAKAQTAFFDAKGTFTD